MDKYGVMKEYICPCGYRVIMPGNQMGSGIVKSGGAEGHVHVLTEIQDGRRPDKSPDIRPD